MDRLLDGPFPKPPPSFRLFWDFTHPKDHPLDGRFTNPRFLSCSCGVLTHPKDSLLVGRFPNPPPSFWFFWGFIHPKDPLLINCFSNPPPPDFFPVLLRFCPPLWPPSGWSFPQSPPSFRFFWGFTHPKDPFWLVVSSTPAFFKVLLGFSPPLGPSFGW